MRSGNDISSPILPHRRTADASLQSINFGTGERIFIHSHTDGEKEQDFDSRRLIGRMENFIN